MQTNTTCKMHNGYRNGRNTKRRQVIAVRGCCGAAVMVTREQWILASPTQLVWFTPPVPKRRLVRGGKGAEGWMDDRCLSHNAVGSVTHGWLGRLLFGKYRGMARLNHPSTSSVKPDKWWSERIFVVWISGKRDLVDDSRKSRLNLFFDFAVFYP